VHRLLLLRHAKSSWAEPGVRDHDRPLAERGRRAAALVGDHLRQQRIVPDLVLCSSARRTCETLALLDLPDGVDIRVTRDLYLAGPREVLDVVRSVDEAVRTLLVIGHNPTTQELALDLAGEGDRGARQRISAKYPTGALAVLTTSCRWGELDAGSAALERFVTPRDLE